MSAASNTDISQTISMQFEALPKGKVVIDVVNVRAARSGDNSPLIISIPKLIADAAACQKGDKMRIYTDGKKIYLDRLEEPEL